MNARNSNQKAPFYFYIVTLSVPIVVLTLIEIGLRLVDVGNDLPLFIEPPGYGDYYVANPSIIERYVGDKNRAPKVAPDATFFRKTKPTDTFRIFVQGGSTAAGFPYGRNASLQGMLYQRFKRQYPDQHIEVISTAMAAVNTYTLRDFVDEIIEQQPDLILIYTGHNEFLGVMGVGSNISASGSQWLTLALIQARKLRLFQAIELMVYGRKRPADSPNKRTLMSTVVRDSSILLESAKFNAGVSQFRANLNAILGQYQQAGIPVLIGNLVSNEQDQPPFSSIQSIDWHAYRQGVSLDQAASNIESLRSQPDWSTNAESHYKLGINWSLLGEYDNANAAFINARDRDQLRFRAPSVFNDIIAGAAVDYGAVLVDIEGLLRSDSDNGILGKQHFLEHVHPNERGYFLLAEAFSEHIQQAGLIRSDANTYSRADAWNDIPITKVDRLSADFVIEKLVNDYPFVATPREVDPPPTTTLEGEALSVQGSGIDWRDYRVELMRRYQQRGDLAEAARIAAGTSDALISDAQLARHAGQRYLQLKDYTMARFYFQRATRLASNDRPSWLGLAEVYFQLGDRGKSEQIMSTLERSGQP